MLWLALFYPDLPLEVFGSKYANKNHPAVVLETDAVILCNAAAKEANILLGSTLRTAQSIYEDLIYFRRDRSLEQKSLDRLTSVLYGLSNRISNPSNHMLLLEIGASLRLFGSAGIISQKAFDLSLGLGHRAIGRVAKTPHAAIALAYSNTDDLSETSVMSASLREAGISEKVIAQMPDMGIDTLEELASLPFDEIGQRFNKDVLRYLNELTGKTPDVRRSITPAQRFIEEVHCLQPITNKSELHQYPKSPVQVLLKQLHHWLRTNQLGCEKLIWEFGTYEADISPRNTSKPDTNRQAQIIPTFSTPQQSVETLLKMTRLYLEQQPLPEEVITVRLKVNRVTLWQGEDYALFDLSEISEKTKNIHKLDTNLLDEMNARLGQGACRGIQDAYSVTPEASWQFVDGHVIHKSQKNKNTDELYFYKKRPLWLTDSPVPIHQTELTLIVGPEKVKSQWWSEQVDRDYYIARQKNGAECWVFKNSSDQWYIHGYF